MSFINKYSFKCLLGPRSKNIKIIDDIYLWDVNKKRHFSTSKELTKADIPLLKERCPCSFHYLSLENTSFLKEHFDVSRSKDRSIILDITDLSLAGRKFKKLRQAVNKCAQNDFTLLSNYKKIEDVKDMIEEWSNEYTDKYFRDFSGKNMFFYKNEFHQDCINLFVYHGDELVSFGSLSPAINGQSSYIIGKALYKRFTGLSEFTDIKLYQKAKEAGISKINMGRCSNKNLRFYKSKFYNPKEEICYAGKIEV